MGTAAQSDVRLTTAKRLTSPWCKVHATATRGCEKFADLAVDIKARAQGVAIAVVGVSGVTVMVA